MDARSLEKKFKKFSTYALIFFALGTLLSGFLMTLGLLENNAFNSNFCLKKDCIINFYGHIEASTITFGATLSITATAITVIGVYFAILNYISTAKTNAISNHLANLRTFNDYLNQEIENEPKINKGSIDIFKWYNLIFPKSKQGILSPGEKYKKKLEELNQTIEYSNKICSTGDTPSFEYKPHQERMRKALAQIGVTIDFLPRNDFKESESQLLNLISKTNKEFCIGGELEEISTPIYF